MGHYGVKASQLSDCSLTSHEETNDFTCLQETWIKLMKSRTLKPAVVTATLEMILMKTRMQLGTVAISSRPQMSCAKRVWHMENRKEQGKEERNKARKPKGKKENKWKKTYPKKEEKPNKTKQQAQRSKKAQRTQTVTNMTKQPSTRLLSSA